MHTHGYKYAVVSQGKFANTTTVTSGFIKSLDESGLINRNFDFPPCKDTVIVPNNGYTIVRFIADNPGFWFFHCHIEFHAEVGMSAVLKVGSRNDVAPKPDNWPQCGDFMASDPKK